MTTRKDYVRKLASAQKGKRVLIVSPDETETWDMTGKLAVVTTEPTPRKICGHEPDFVTFDEVADYSQEK